MSDNTKRELPEYGGGFCEKCGTPLVHGAEHSVVLFFKTATDAREFVDLVGYELNLAGFAIGEPPKGEG